MTRITLQDGKVVVRDGQVGTEQACCCGEECSGSCVSSEDCGEGCCCAITWNGGSPGFLVQACRAAADDYACCCDSYKKLCYVDASKCIPSSRSGDFPPNIAGSPPANAIVLSNSDGLYCDVNRAIEGFWVDDDACYDYGYYTAVDDCGACAGTCTDWFDTNALSPGFWQILCDCATSNDVDLCQENPLP